MMEWQPIETAPKDINILLFGMIDPDTTFELLRWVEPIVFSGRWDAIDEYFVPSGGTWEGPFMRCTHWAHLPEPPK